MLYWKQFIGGLVNAFTKLDKMPEDRSVFYPAFLYNWKFQVENTMKKTNDFTEGSILPKLPGTSGAVLRHRHLRAGGTLPQLFILHIRSVL